MASSRRLIASQTLSSSAASVTFSSIPSGYKDLILKVSARSDSTDNIILMSFNGDTSGVWSRTSLRGDGSAASSGNNTSLARMQLEYSDTSSMAASTFNNMEIYIPSYLASQNKPISNFGVQETNATAASMASSAGLWRITSAVSSITLSFASSNFVSGSSFYLYGLAN